MCPACGLKPRPVVSVFKNVAVVAGRLALPQCEDVGKANQHRHERNEE